MASNVTRDHHNIRRNVELNDNYISNDGGDEGISIVDAGGVKLSTHLTIADQALAPNHESHHGKIWINNFESPNALYFTNELGDDIPLTKGDRSVATSGTLAADDILVGDAAVSIATTTGDIVFKGIGSSGTETFLTLYTSDTTDGSDSGTESELLGPNNAALILRAQGTQRPLMLTSGQNVLIACGSDASALTSTGVMQELKGSYHFLNDTCDWDASPGLDDGNGDDPANISHDDDDGKIHVGLECESEAAGGIGNGSIWEDVIHVESDTFFRISKDVTADASNAIMNFREPGNITYLTMYKGTLSAAWQINQGTTVIRPVGTQNHVDIPAQVRGTGVGSKAKIAYTTNKDGQPAVNLAPYAGGYGYTSSFTDYCTYNYVNGVDDDGTTSSGTDIANISRIYHSDDNGAIKLYMSVVGDGIPVGAYVGEVDAAPENAWFRIHKGGGTGAIDPDDRVAVTTTNASEKLFFYERVCYQDGHASGDNYGCVEVQWAADGMISLGTQTPSQASNVNRSTVSKIHFNFTNDNNNTYNEMVSAGPLKIRGAIGGKMQLDFDTIFLSGTDHLGRSGQEYTFLHGGDRMFFGNSACNTCDIFIDSQATDNTRRLYIGASTLPNGTAKLGSSDDWGGVGGLEIAVTNSTGATSINSSHKTGGDNQAAHMLLEANGNITLKPQMDMKVLFQKFYAGTDDATPILQDLEYTIIGDTDSGEEISHIAHNITMDATADDGAGTGNFTGIDVNVTADGTTGTKNAKGIDIAVSGGDTNTGMLITQTAGTHLKLAKDANDYATFTVADTGDLTIATVGDGDFDSDLNLDADGYIILDADGGRIELRDGGTRFGYFSTDASKSILRLFEAAGATTSDYLNIQTVTNGLTTIATIDAAGTNADLILDVHGSITLDSETGAFIAKHSATEFSVANSAYAGMILGYRVIGEDAGEAYASLGTSFATIHDDCNVTFKAPPSGNVEITVQAYIETSSYSEVIEFALSTTDTTSFSSLGVEYEQKVSQGDRSEDGVIQLSWVVTGLTPQAIDTYWFAAEATTGSTRLYWGGDATSDYPVFIMKVTALPAAVTDYAVYG